MGVCEDCDRRNIKVTHDTAFNLLRGSGDAPCRITVTALSARRVRLDGLYVQTPSDIYVKYALIDQTNELRNTSVNYYLVWDHMPVTGRLFMEREQGSVAILPNEYF